MGAVAAVDAILGIGFSVAPAAQAGPRTRQFEPVRIELDFTTCSEGRKSVWLQKDMTVVHSSYP
jgi:hypothetical protein